MKYILIAIAVLAFGEIKAQLRLGLDDARKLLRTNSNSIRQSELQQKVAQIDLKETYYALIPNLTFNVTNQHTLGLNFDQVTGQLITGDQWNNTTNATVGSNLFSFQGFKFLYNIKAAKLETELTEMDTERLKFELDLQLLALFFQALINVDLYNASLEQAKLSTRLVEQEEIKLSVGKGTLLDLVQARSKLAEDQLNVASTRNASQLNILKLKQLLELPSSTVIELDAPKRNPFHAAEQHFHSILHRDPYIQPLEKKIEISIIQSKIARASNYPILSLNTGYGTNYSSRRLMSNFPFDTMPFVEQFNKNRSLFIGLGISYNIFNRYTTKGNIRKSRINTENLNLEMDKMILERKRVLEQAELDYQAALEEQKAVEVAYNASKTNYEAMNERYEVGKSSSIDLYKALTDYNINEFRRITNKYDALLKVEILNLLLSVDRL